MKFLVILLFYFIKCYGDVNIGEDIEKNTVGDNNDIDKETSQLIPKPNSEISTSGHMEVPPNLKMSSEEPPCPAYPPPPGMMCLPKFAIYLIASSMVLMFIIIIYLVYALQKAKSSGYKYIANDTSTANRSGGYNRQESQEQATSPITPLDGITIEDTYFKHTSSMRDVSRNITTPTSCGRKDSKVTRIIKNAGNPQTNLILREQIKEICEGVLNNPIALKSKGAFLLEIEGLERRPSHKRLTREKSASTPQLDIYDTIPAMSSKNSITSIDKNKSSEEPKATKTNLKNNEDKKTEEEDDENPIYDNPPAQPEPCNIDNMPVYECPPPQPPKITVNGFFETDNRAHNRKSVVDDTDYLLVLDEDSSENHPPIYTNAKNNDFML